MQRECNAFICQANDVMSIPIGVTFQHQRKQHKEKLTQIAVVITRMKAELG